MKHKVQRQKQRFITKKSKQSKRKCLRCDKSFLSKGPCNRVCYNCSLLEEYQYIGDDYGYGN